MTLTVYKPECSELWFKQLMLSDEETMSYNHAWGGTIPFPEDRWTDWYDRWIINPEGKRYYRYLKNEAGEWIGEIAWHFDVCLTGYLADVVIYAKYRGRGYGSKALSMLCSIAKEQGISVLYDDIAIDNPAIGMFLRHGFSEEYRTDQSVMLKKELQNDFGRD